MDNILNQALPAIGNVALKAAGSVANPIIDAINQTLADTRKIQAGSGNPIQKGLAATGAMAKNTVFNPRVLADLGSLAVPFGRGANLLSKTVLPSAAVGGLSEAAQPDASLPSIAGSALTAPILPSVLHGVGSRLPAATNIGNKVLQTQYNVKPTTAAQIDLPAAIAKLADYGFTSLNDVSKVHPQVTGRDGIITKMTRAAVGGAGPVNLGAITDEGGNQVNDSLSNITNNLLMQHTQIQPNAENKFKDMMNRGVEAMTNGNITNADPLAVFDFAKSLEAQGAKLGRSQDIAAKEMANVFNGVASDLKERVFTHSGADSSLATNVLTPENIGALNKISPKLAQDAQGVQTVGQLRSLAAPFVQGGRLADETDAKSNTRGMSLTQMLPLLETFGRGDPAGAAIYLSQTGIGKNLTGKALRGIGSMANQFSTDSLPPIAQRGLNIAGNQGISRLPSVIGNGNEASPQSNQENNNTSNHGQSISQYDTTVNTPAQIPQSQDQIKQRPDGTYGIANPYTMKDPSDPTGNTPLFLSANDIKSQQQAINARKNSLLYKNSQAEQTAVGKLQDDLDTKAAFSQPINDQFPKVLTKSTAYSQAIRDAQEAGPDLANYNGTYDNFVKQISGKYASLATQLKTLESEGAVNPNVEIKGSTLLPALQTAHKGALMQFYGTLNNQVGFTGQGGTQVQSSPQAVPQAAPSIPKGFNPMAGMNQSLPAIQ